MKPKQAQWHLLMSNYYHSSSYTHVLLSVRIQVSESLQTWFICDTDISVHSHLHLNCCTPKLLSHTAHILLIWDIVHKFCYTVTYCSCVLFTSDTHLICNVLYMCAVILWDCAHSVNLRQCAHVLLCYDILCVCSVHFWHTFNLRCTVYVCCYFVRLCTFS
jgi:hypothetical protein